MIIFLFCEVMFFAGMISDYQPNAVGGIWLAAWLAHALENADQYTILLVACCFMAHRPSMNTQCSDVGFKRSGFGALFCRTTGARVELH